MPNGPEHEILVADVIPAAKLPKEIPQFFSYSVPQEFENSIKTGTIVQIPFRKKKITGIVLKLYKARQSQFKYKLKEISSVFEKGLYLSYEVLELAKYTSDYYFSPLSLVIKTVIPAFAKNKPRKKIATNENVALSQVNPESCDFVIRNIKEKNLLIHSLSAERHSLYLEIIKKNLSENCQALLLLPENFDVFNFSGYYLNALGKDNVSILTSELTDSQYFFEWKKIKDGTAKLVIGTRMSVFAPFQNLRLIIADNEHSSSFKQWDMNPRYNSINLASELSSIWKAKLVLSSFAPSVENYFRAKQKNFNIIELPKDSEQKKIEIIDMEYERKKGNFSPICDKLKSCLLDAIYQKKQALIFLPKLGINTVTKCKDCEFMAHCEDCKGLLTSFENSLYCTRCRKKFETIKKCPVCGGQNISSFGHGIEAIEKEILNIFKNKNIKISRLDSTTAQNKSRQQKILEKFLSRKTDILIGTQMAVKNWNIENLSVFAVLFPEIIFNQPDFRSRERSFQFLSGLKNESGKAARIIIETFDKNNPIFKSAFEHCIEDFYMEEIDFRRNAAKIGYPPFSTLIKLIYKNSDKEKGKKEAFDMYEILKKEIGSQKRFSDNFEIIKPYAAQNFREYGKYRHYIVLKYSGQNTESRDLILRRVKKDWIIDIDPDSLL